MLKGTKGNGRTIRAIELLPDAEIQRLASLLNNEDDVLGSFGLRKDQVERTKRNVRWRKNWDMGYSKGTVNKNEELFNSTEPSIQKLYAEKVLPQAFESDMVIDWKAPKWFYEELEMTKIKKARVGID